MALERVQQLNLTPETRSDADGLRSYLNSFESILMSSFWLKILTAINFRSLVLQAREATLDVEVTNILDLIEDLKQLRDRWDDILAESKLVADGCGIDPSLHMSECDKKRKRKRLLPDKTVLEDDFSHEDPYDRFKRCVYYPVLDSVVGNLTVRYDAARNLCNLFGVLWKYPNMSSDDMRCGAKKLAEIYSVDVADDLISELDHLKTIHAANLGNAALSPLELLNSLRSLKMDALFPNIIVILRIFCTLPVTVAEAERSFSTLARVKNVIRSTVSQDRLKSLGTLAVEARLARTVDFNSIIELFASRKARKVPLL